MIKNDVKDSVCRWVASARSPLSSKRPEISPMPLSRQKENCEEYFAEVANRTAGYDTSDSARTCSLLRKCRIYPGKTDVDSYSLYLDIRLGRGNFLRVHKPVLRAPSPADSEAQSDAGFGLFFLGRECSVRLMEDDLGHGPRRIHFELNAVARHAFQVKLCSLVGNKLILGLAGGA